MLSYDSPVAVNGQGPASPTSISPMQSVPASPKSIRRLSSGSATGLSGGVASSASPYSVQNSPRDHHIWLVTGPAGCGKSTVAEYLARSLNLPFIEGDQFHPKANIEKMSHGIPLTDADRWDWLTALREESIKQLNAGHAGVVLTCSALKRKYRDVIRVAPYFSPNLHLHFIYLHAPEEVLTRRVAARKGHYMPSSLVHSQFDILEPPTPDEVDVINIDVSRSIEEVEADTVDKALQAMDKIREKSKSQ